MQLKFWGKKKSQQSDIRSVVNQPVKKILETMQMVSVDRVKKASRAVETLESGIDKNYALTMQMTLGVEAEARKKVEEETQKMEYQLGQMQRFIDLSSKYPELSLEPLTWRCEKGLPLLAVYPIDQPEMLIRGGGNWANAGFYSDFPGALAELFSDVGKKMGRFETIASKFDAIVPDEIKQIIEAKKADFDKIFIIAEATWRVRTDPDPIVAGWAAGKLWLIASWEMTSIEKEMSLSLSQRAFN